MCASSSGRVAAFFLASGQGLSQETAERQEKSVVFWRVHTLYLSANKSHQCLSLSVVWCYVSACQSCLQP
jgi:hypothetical protein